MKRRAAQRQRVAAPPVGTDRPAPTVTGNAATQWVVRDGAGGIVHRLTARDALTLQGFDPAYPVRGTKAEQGQQIGNAVPPPLAAHIIAALTGAHYERNVA